MIQYCIRMNKAWIFLIVLVFSVGLQSVAQQSLKPIKLQLLNQPFQQLVTQIELQSNYHFYYEESVFDSLKVSVDFENASVNQILDKSIPCLRENESYFYRRLPQA